jgi:CubicO group peptidase (beta-lactamase class C family)
VTLKPIEIETPSNPQVESLAQKLEQQCSAGFALAVIKDGVTIHKQHYGAADVAHNVAVNTDTKFPIASISKIYTAVILHHLVKEGMVELDKPLNHYVPETEDAGKASLRSVLLMTSGLCDAFEVFMMSGASNLTTHKIAEHFLAEQIFLAEGQSYQNHFIYSNSAYIFLAQLIENVTGKSYETVLKEVIFEPLGLNDTDYFDGRWRVVENLATPNVLGDDERDDAGAENYIGRFFRNMAGAGHLAATLDDMVIFAKALAGFKLCGVNVNDMLKKDSLIGEIPSFYGHGLQAVPLNNRFRMIGHNGSYHGIKTALFIEPKTNAVIVLLSNDNDIDAVKWAVDFLAAASGEALAFKVLADDVENKDALNAEPWLCADTGLGATLYRDSHLRQIEIFGDKKDLIFLGEGKYMVPYAVAPIFLSVIDAENYTLNIGGVVHKLQPVQGFAEAPKNFMEYVGRYKNPNSEIENHVKSDFKGGLNMQFGGVFNAIEDAPLRPIAKDYFSCEITEYNGAPLSIYVRFEREQFSQMISGYSIHAMRVPSLTFRRLKTV